MQVQVGNKCCWYAVNVSGGSAGGNKATKKTESKYDQSTLFNKDCVAVNKN